MDIKQFIKSLDIKVFLEIGCHFGTDTEDFRKFHPNARIVCFEPDPRNINILKNRGIDKIAEIHEFAVSDTNGTAEFYLSSGDAHWTNGSEIWRTNDWSASSSLKHPTDHLNVHRWITFNNKVQVNTIRLDDFEPLKDTKIDFIWADVQGAEDLVFSGAKELLSRTRYVYTEYCNQQLYSNQLNLEGILKLFGPDWEVICDYGGDVLLRNSNIKV